MSAAHAELTCRELVELVTAYLDGMLTGDERARFELHLGACRGCREYLRQLEAVIAAAGRLAQESVPREAREALLGAFRGWKTRERGV